MTSQESSVQERVARGVELLDEKFPDWWADVNIDTLSMESGHACIVQQVWGHDYWRVVDGFTVWMRMSRERTYEFFVSLGFDVDPCVEDGSATAALDWAWKTVIETRRAGA